MIEHYPTYQNIGYESTLDLFETFTTHIQYLPTGGGKTVIGGRVMQTLVQQKKNVWFLVDQIILASQSRDEINKHFGLGVYLIDSNTSDLSFTFDNHCAVGMIQTINARINNDDDHISSYWKRACERVDYVIIDEAHQLHASAMIENGYFPNAKICGLTATPKAEGDKPLAHYYKGYNQIASAKEMTEEGWLVPFLHRTDGQGLDVKLGKGSSDYSQSAVNRQFKKLGKVKNLNALLNKCNEDFAQYFNSHTLKGVIYANGSGYVKELKNTLFEQGKAIDMVLSTGQTATQRDNAINFFKAGYLHYLVNMQIMVKGFNHKPVNLVVLMFKTSSISKYIQATGRGSRPVVEGLHLMRSKDQRLEAIAKSDKPFCVLMDLGGNVSNFGKFDEDRDWEAMYLGLDKSKGSNDAPMKQCPECNGHIHASSSRCDNEYPSFFSGGKGLVKCDYLFPKKETQDREASLVDLDDADNFMMVEALSRVESKPLALMSVVELFEHGKKTRQKFLAEAELAKRGDLKSIENKAMSRDVSGAKAKHDYIKDMALRGVLNNAQAFQVLNGVVTRKIKSEVLGSQKNSYNRKSYELEFKAKDRLFMDFRKGHDNDFDALCAVYKFKWVKM